MTLLNRITRDQRGAVAILGGVGILIALGAATVAADMARITMAQGRLQRTIDAATLAGSRSLWEGEAAARAVARAVFDANMLDPPSGMVAREPEFALARDSAGDPIGIIGVASADVELMMGGLGALLGDAAPPGVTVLQAAARSERRVQSTEVAIVLDNTGSMGGAKIAALRASTTALIQALFGGSESVPGLTVAIVPYSANVNIGRQHIGWLRQSDRTAGDAPFAPTTWKGCVRVRSVADLESDNPPDAAGDLEPFLTPSTEVCPRQIDDDDDDDRHDRRGRDDDDDRSARDDDDDDDRGRPRRDDDGDDDDEDDEAPACVRPLGDAIHERSPNVWPRFAADAPRDDPGFVDESVSAKNKAFGPNLGCPAPILPLTAVRAELDAMVPQLEAWSRGGTLGNLGLSWGWRALSPRWRGQWLRADATPIVGIPRDAEEAGRKIIVMMTDGDNAFHQIDDTALGRAGEMLSGSAQIDASMSRLCAAIKDEGIIIYTITFGNGVNANTANRYRTCATDPALDPRVGYQTYFHAPSGDALTQAFANIAGQISDLRLVE